VIVAASTLTVTLVSAGAGIAGAVLGGTVAGIVSLRAEDKRQRFAREEDETRRQREDRQERLLAVGAARAWRMRLLRIGITYSRSVRLEQWWDVDTELLPPPPLEDQKRVASALDSRSWGRVQMAEFSVASTFTVRRGRAEIEEEHDEPDPGKFKYLDKEILQYNRHLLVQGLDALAELAEVTDEDDPVEVRQDLHLDPEDDFDPLEGERRRGRR
jgi:hypothetical protein